MFFVPPRKFEYLIGFPKFTKFSRSKRLETDESTSLKTEVTNRTYVIILRLDERKLEHGHFKDQMLFVFLFLDCVCLLLVKLHTSGNIIDNLNKYLKLSETD